jgi:hypothetical protein
LKLNDLYSYFTNGHKLILEKKYDDAIQVFEEIVNGEDTSYHSGAYVNLARCHLENLIKEEGREGLKDQDKDQQIHTYLDRALYYKPTNQSAINIFFNYHFAYGRYVEAIDYFLKLDKAIADECMDYLLLLRTEEDEQLIQSLEKVFEKYPHYAELGGVIGHMFINIEDYHKAYYHYRKLEETDKEDLNALIGLGLVCNIIKNL